MGILQNQNVWNRHYQEDRSRQSIPDENVVRFFQHYLRKNPANASPRILEIGSGSGRNLAYLQSCTTNAYGMDFAFNALRNQKGVVCGLSHENPFAGDTFDIVIAWGVLHYLTDEMARKTVSEVRRVLKKNGIFYGTIRSSQDTHLRDVLSSGDLSEGGARLFSREEAANLLSEFGNVRFGFIMRQNPGDERIIAHHIFETSA